MRLLREAAAALEEPFLLVIAGEFNSGKSSAVNALLGGRFLTEGVLPTTNEISVLHYAGSADSPIRSETAADGRLDIYLPCEILQARRNAAYKSSFKGASPHVHRAGLLSQPTSSNDTRRASHSAANARSQELSIVDTPGTNVILERQQRLTEEFIPRADLVLFVLSTDRPFTDSEVKFLQYIRCEWNFAGVVGGVLPSAAAVGRCNRESCWVSFFAEASACWREMSPGSLSPF